MKKILPIDKECKIYSYTYHLFTNAIANNKERTGNLIGKVRLIEDSFDAKWKLEKKKGKVLIQDNVIKRYYDKYDSFTSASIYRECEEDDMIVIEILYQQQNEPWASINLFLAKNDGSDMCVHENYTIRYGRYSKIGIYANIGDEMYMKGEEYSIPKALFLKLIRKHKSVTMYYSYDNNDWIEFKSCTVENTGKYNIGINISSRCKEYYNWLYANYIQLTYNVNGPTHLDYYIGFQRSWNYYNTFYFAEYEHTNTEIVKRYENDIFEYIKKVIDQDKYLIVYLDEFYIPHRPTYNIKSFPHENIIYGYDDKKKVVYSMGYGDKIKPCCSLINVEDFKIAYYQCPNSKILTMKYDMDVSIYEINLERISRFLKDYLSGYNSSKDIDYIASKNDFIYGINIYEELLKNNDRITTLIQDKRIGYLFSEHKEIMKKRIEYLYYYKVFSRSDYNYLMDGMKKICNKAHSIINLIIRYDINGDVNKLNKMIQYIFEMKEMEQKYYSYLIDLIDIRIIKDRLIDKQ